jgi:hypothetical protein
MMETTPTLMGFWLKHKMECRPIGGIIEDAREGKLPGVQPISSGFGFEIIDPQTALKAMRKDAA